MLICENEIDHACDISEGRFWISANGKRPDTLCPEAWKSMAGFVQALAIGEGNLL